MAIKNKYNWQKVHYHLLFIYLGSITSLINVLFQVSTTYIQTWHQIMWVASCCWMFLIFFHSFEGLLISEARVEDFTGLVWLLIGTDRCSLSCLHGCRVSLYPWRTQRQAAGQPSCLMLMHSTLGRHSGRPICH